MRAEDYGLPACGFQADHAAAADFAAGAGGGWDGDQGRHRGIDLVAAILQVIVVLERQRVGRLQTNRFCRVDRAAAAEGDEAVAVLGLVRVETWKDTSFRRISFDAVENRP